MISGLAGTSTQAAMPVRDGRSMPNRRSEPSPATAFEKRAVGPSSIRGGRWTRAWPRRSRGRPRRIGLEQSTMLAIGGHHAGGDGALKRFSSSFGRLRTSKRVRVEERSSAGRCCESGSASPGSACRSPLMWRRRREAVFARRADLAPQIQADLDVSPRAKRNSTGRRGGVEERQRSVLVRPDRDHGRGNRHDKSRPACCAAARRPGTVRRK